jgi:hypothetical protein
VILDPAVIALLSTSILTTLLLLYSTAHGLVILKRWNLESGSEYQLGLERRTYLVSTIMTYCCAFQLLSLFLYVFTADNLHRFFVGAMCAAGTLNVNPYGYPTLVMKIVGFLAAGTWLIFNHVDNRAPDYPLIRKKYLFLLMMAPVAVAETVGLANYFLRLNPDIITSCCGTLFSAGSGSVQSGLAGLPPTPMKIIFSVSIGSTMVAGLHLYLRDRSAYLFSILALFAFAVSLASIVSFISLYFYDLPTHHCPFCILQREYWYAGYPLYVTLFGGAVCGMGVGVLQPFSGIETLKSVIPTVQRRLALATILLYGAFSVLVASRIIVSPLMLR